MDVAAAIEHWHLEPHPEGGFYRRTYTAEVAVVPPGWPGARPVATAILYLLPAGVRSRRHRVRGEELWLWQGGGALDLDVTGTTHRLGPDPTEHALQVRVPAGAWQSAVPASAEWSLVACVVAPGFSWDDFELAVDESGPDTVPSGT
jgi:predicted cupin superfamily sugar epimerase